MSSVKKLRCRSVEMFDPDDNIKAFHLKMNKDKLFKKLSEEVEDNTWYFIKFDEEIQLATNKQETQFRSELKYFAIKDVNTYYAKPISLNDEFNPDEVMSVFSVATHDDVRAELTCKSMELNDLKRAYEELKSKYKERVRRHHELMQEFNNLVDEEDALIDAISEEGFTVKLEGGVRIDKN